MIVSNFAVGPLPMTLNQYFGLVSAEKKAGSPPGMSLGRRYVTHGVAWVFKMKASCRGLHGRGGRFPACVEDVRSSLDRWDTATPATQNYQAWRDHHSDLI